MFGFFRRRSSPHRETARRECKRKPLTVRPMLEELERRLAPATFLVSNLNDSGGGSLRQAILDANSNPGADLVQFTGAGASGTITLTTAEIDITDSVTIQGPGAAALTVSGNDAFRIFYINDGVPNVASKVTISGLTLTKGNA